MQTIEVMATWDSEVCVWTATSEDMTGLALEAATLDALAERLRTVIPELLELNGQSGGYPVPFRLHGERLEMTRAA
ncbi:MAG: DUF1902 domain-containing protein [Methylococcaceae bacterium]|nr:MAG: DUF1902 domain-containing protein [Methylococcaceae bacterium]